MVRVEGVSMQSPPSTTSPPNIRKNLFEKHCIIEKNVENNSVFPFFYLEMWSCYGFGVEKFLVVGTYLCRYLQGSHRYETA